MQLDITATLKRLELARYNAKVTVMMRRGSPYDDVVQIKEHNELGMTTVIRGPMFDAETKGTTWKYEDGTDASSIPFDNNVRALQAILLKYGYYDVATGGLDELDGLYGQNTAAAVTKFQNTNADMADEVNDLISPFQPL